MLKIGLTGGLGSGKTTVAHIFEVLGVPVYYADNASKRLMNEDDGVKDAVQKAFGADAYKNDELDRKYLSDIVFSNKEKLALLNSIVHPATIKDAEEWMKKQSSPYVIKEAALLFESGANKTLDYVIGVKSPLQMRLQRAMERDNILEEEIMNRINKQMDEEEKLDLCDFIIINDEEQLVIPQVLAIHEKFLFLTKKIKTLDIINIAQKFSLFSDYFNPRIIGELNGQHVKAAKLKGEFTWHSHQNEDELFFVIKGKLKIEFRDKIAEINEGEFIIVPKGVEHKPVADEEVHVLLFEPAATLNTGNVENEFTRPTLQQL